MHIAYVTQQLAWVDLLSMCKPRCGQLRLRPELCNPAHAPPWLPVQVSVYGRSRLSQDVFLGEVLIPLREVEEAGASGVSEVHKYILGRRSTKERVSGEIALACSWRVTPLDVVIMKVSLLTPLPSLPLVTAPCTNTWATHAASSP